MGGCECGRTLTLLAHTSFGVEQHSSPSPFGEGSSTSAERCTGHGGVLAPTRASARYPGLAASAQSLQSKRGLPAIDDDECCLAAGSSRTAARS